MRLEADEPVHSPAGRPPRPGRGSAIAVGVVVLLTAILVVVLSRIEEPLRRSLERRVNASLTGYTVSIGNLDLHLIGLAVELQEVTMVQNQRPTPPVLYLPSWRTSLEWRSLLSLALVADTSFVRPEVYITLEQTAQETEDETKLTERGWQDAIQAVYPLEINSFRIVEGTISYYDVGRVPPLELEHVEFRASNIRNVRSVAGENPSPIALRAEVLGGSIDADGHADFLAKPYPTLDAGFDLQRADLAPMAPMARRFDLIVSKGTIGTSGRLVLDPKQTTVDLATVVVSEPSIEYVRDPRPQQRQVEKAVVVATQAATKPGVRVTMRDVKIERGTLALKVDALRRR